MRRALAVVPLVAALLATGAPPPAQAVEVVDAVGATSPARTKAQVLHRVVWDEGRKNGVHLWSARPDGSDKRKIYQRRNSFVTVIALNRRGAAAAVAPVVGEDRPAELVVVDVLGRARTVDVLTDHPEIRAVSAVGWSPSGRALVFKGAVGPTEDSLEGYLFRVDRDGGRLRRLVPLGGPVNPYVIEQETPLVWTRDGIFHHDEEGLHRVRAGRDRVVLDGVVGQAVSGDGTWLYVERLRRARYAMWRMHPDGTGLERLCPLNHPYLGYDSAPGQGYTYQFQPSHDGRTMLSQLDRSQTDIEPVTLAHPAMRGPVKGDRVLPVGSFGPITWN